MGATFIKVHCCIVFGMSPVAGLNVGDVASLFVALRLFAAVSRSLHSANAP